MAETLSEQLAEYRASWRARVPADRQALMDQHIAHLAATGIDRSAKQVGDRAPAIRLRDQHGEDFDIADLLAKGPVVVTFYRGGWCPFCNLELTAYQAVLPRIAAAGARHGGDQPRKAGRYRRHGREERAELSRAQRCRPAGRQSLWR